MSSWKEKRLDGKIVIVTGANTGIGKATASILATRGARVILACRSLDKAVEAADDIRRTGDVDESNVVVMKLDLGDFQSVRSFAEEFNSMEPRLDILINNAGVMLNKRTITPEGNEMTFQVNHLGHFLLTNLLLEKLKASAPSRVVTVASDGYTFTREINFNDLSFESNYSMFKAYSHSKLANVLFTQELYKRLQGSGVTTYALNPGIVKTEMGRDFNPCVYGCFRCILAGCSKTPAEGAATTIFCATADDIPSGEYYNGCRRRELKSCARNPSAAAELWRRSEELVGLVTPY